ncbi:MAG: glycosyltransferase family 39 protein [Vicinamibacterales bacterium]
MPASAVLVVLLAWYTLGVGPTVFTSGDDVAYATTAIDIATRAPLVHQLESPAFGTHFVALTRVPNGYAPKTPLGTSLLLVPFYLVAGMRGLFMLGPLMGVLGVAALFDLTRQLTGRRRPAWIAAALLASVPPLVAHAAVIGSDVASLTIMTAALAVYVRHVKTPQPLTFALFALLAGAAVVVRAPNAILFAAAIAHQAVTHRAHLIRRLPLLFGGCLIVALLAAIQLTFNLVTFGALAGGYQKEVNAEAGLALANLPSHLPGYLLMLSAIPPFGLIAMAVVVRRERWSGGGVYALLAGITLAFVTFYSAWWAFDFDYTRGFVGGARFVLPVLPILCLFVAVWMDSASSRTLRTALVGGCLTAQVAASLVLTYQLRLYKERMATHRDAIIFATAPGSLVVGPEEWHKLMFGVDVEGRQYATYDFLNGDAGERELFRLIDERLNSRQPAYLLGSGSRETPEERDALAAVRRRYQLRTVLDVDAPYQLLINAVGMR